MTQYKISSIFSDNATKAINLLKQPNSKLTYQIRSIEGRTVLDILIDHE